MPLAETPEIRLLTTPFLRRRGCPKYRYDDVVAVGGKAVWFLVGHEAMPCRELLLSTRGPKLNANQAGAVQLPPATRVHQSIRFSFDRANEPVNVKAHALPTRDHVERGPQERRP